MKRSAMKGLGLWLMIGCAYLPAPAPDWIEAETTVARRGVVAVGEAAAAEGIAGADMVAASQLAGALDAWLAPALTLLEPDVAKEIFVQVALVASVNDRWVDPADGSHLVGSCCVEDVDKVIRRALHGDERLEQVLEALPGKLKEGTKMTARAPDWMQLKWSQVPEGMRRELPLSHVIEAKDNGVNEASKEDKEDLELMDSPLQPPAVKGRWRQRHLLRQPSRRQRRTLQRRRRHNRRRREPANRRRKRLKTNDL